MSKTETIRQKIYDRLRMQSIFRRVNTISLIIGIIAMVLITTICIDIYIQSTMDLLQERESRFLSLYSTNISNELFSISKEISTLCNGESMQEMLVGDYPLTPQATQYKKLVLTQEVEQCLSCNDAVTDVYLFTTRDTPINLFRGPNGDLQIQSLDTIMLFYETNFFSVDGAYFLDASVFSADPEQNRDGILCMYRIVATGTSKTRGYLLIYLDKQALFGTLHANENEENDVSRFILDADGNFVYAQGSRPSQTALERLHLQMNQKEGAFSISDSEGLLGHICVYAKINGFDFYAVTTIPYEVVSQSVFLILSLVLVLLALVICIYSIASRCIALSISQPVEQILLSLRDIQQENFLIGPYDAHADELAVVNNSLNSTKLLLSDLITKIQENEAQKYQLRLQVLQTQINPHFLVNTLNSIIWLANLQGADNIRTLTASLIEVLVPCIRNTSGVASIGAELALLRDYSIIMDFQYMNQFRLEFDIEERCKDYLAPVLFLQPLVENALIHGRDVNSPMLNILVRARIEDGRIHICVHDDGKGMSPQRLKEVAEGNSKKEKAQTLTRIGVSNIKERMGLLFGQQNYSLTITSAQNSGTTVDICFPMMIHEMPKNEENTLSR